VLELLYPWSKFANFYFLCVGLMQMWKDVSLTNGQPSSFATLSFIILCEMFFKGKEEWQRFRGDRATNRETVEILAPDEAAVAAASAPSARSPSSMRDRMRSVSFGVTSGGGGGSGGAGGAGGGGGGQFVKRTWADVRVGDVVRVHARETFPADLLLLRGSDPPGQCWVNTKPLDGETDTKLRLAPKRLAELLDKPEACTPSALTAMLAGGYIRCEEPNDKVNDITAQLCLRPHVLKERLLLSEENFLLRGCQLRNTDWVLGLVAATGVQTKIQYFPGAEKVGQPMPLSSRLWQGLVDMLAGKGAKPKMGRTAKMVNVDIMGVVVWLILMCVCGGLLYMWWEYDEPEGSIWYLGDDSENAGLAFVKMACRFFLICYQFVPISLYVSMMFYQTICRAFVMVREGGERRGESARDGARDSARACLPVTPRGLPVTPRGLPVTRLRLLLTPTPPIPGP
jgi:hypothetical protein